MAYANEHRPWQLYETVFHQLRVSLDSTCIDLCGEVYDWAQYKQTKGGIKVHTVLNHEGYLPCFAVITDGKASDVAVGRTLKFDKGTIVAMDKG